MKTLICSIRITVKNFRSFRLLSITTLAMSKPKVLITRADIPKKGLNMLSEKCELEIWQKNFPIPRDELLKKVSGKDALLCLLTDKIDKEVLDAAGPSLKIIATLSAGHDHLDLSEMKSRGIKVGYTPGIGTEATAELTIALLLATSRRLFEAHGEVVNGGWRKCSWSPTWMNGWGLGGSTVGVFGFGSIGQAVVRHLLGFGVKRFVYTSRSPKKEGTELGASHVSFDELLKDSDFIIITCALTDETRGIFNEEAFAKMKKSAIIVNTARGGVIKQEALIKALKTNQIRAAGLDVVTPEPLPADHELIGTPNCIIIPHIGSAEVATREEMAILTAANIIAGLENKPMPEKLC